MRFSPQDREDAAVLCDMVANDTSSTFEGVAEAACALGIGLSSPALALAVAATGMTALAHDASASGLYDSDSEMWADASALIRDGWLPTDGISVFDLEKYEGAAAVSAPEESQQPAVVEATEEPPAPAVPEVTAQPAVPADDDEEIAVEDEEPGSLFDAHPGEEE